MTPRMITNALKSGEWTLLYPAVYLLAGASPSWMSKLSGAVAGGGEMAAASHRAAAYLYGLDGFGAPVVEITSPKQMRWPGVIAHRGPQLLHYDIKRIKKIPTASPNMTLIGLGSVVPEHRLEGALDSALTKGLTSLQYLNRRLTEGFASRHPSTAALRKLLDVRLNGQPPTESELERLYHRRITLPYSLPKPAFQFPVQTKIKKRRIDFAYPQIRLGIDVLGWEFHGAFIAWQQDMDRHNELVNEGWEMLYFPWPAIKTRSEHVASQVVEAINRLTPSLLVK